MFKCIADLIRKIDTITYEELRAAIALLKLPEGHFLTQIYLPCAYAFHNLLDKLIDKELHYYLTPHHICLYWDAAADASESDRLPVGSFCHGQLTTTLLNQVPSSTRSVLGTSATSLRTGRHSRRSTAPSTIRSRL